MSTISSQRKRLVRGMADRLLSWRMEESRLGWLLILPTLIVFAGIVFFPLLYSIYLSFHSTAGFGMNLTWVGVRNYVTLLQNPTFWEALTNNVLWTVGTVSIQLVLGVAVALLLHKSFAGRNTVRGAALFPYMVPTIVAVFNFRWIFNATYGVFNSLLLMAGVVQEPISFFGYDLALVSAIMLGVWRFTPFVIITVLARLQTIPPSLYEAAKLDGAYKIAQFRYVTLPQLYNILVIVVLLRVIWMFHKFAPIYLLTGGGPGTSTQTLPIYAYIEAYTGLHFGFAAAIANVMFVLLMIAGLLYIRRFYNRGGTNVQA
ncbi:MAG: sugar ABC transporter permease [Natronomonas sp.]|uniref:carbohydrate ABC transporter permease n=1 Tax=Natronomonas sp. TaxID=2184060 RepID=UPI0028706A7A|nr:sugar ABC transporter permease [Natronomonas sp.]MDR9380579.1 sugar ABC transporter permease [Natronomonas sp.]MDR9430652.1 sugar ABC transporter permease [Natronomonas sp.]